MGIQHFGTTQAKKMSKLERIPTQDFDRDVTATAMDDRFILVGQVDGKLHAVYHKNGVSAFSVKIAECEITAVCCEEQDETDNPIFYAGDVEGNLYTVNKKGKVLKTAKLQAKKIRTLEFKSPVKQVMSCRHHEGDAATDKIYILLWDGNLYSVTGAMLMDPEIEDKALDLKIAVKDEDDGSDDEDEKGEYNGFCVFGKKICVYGNDGLFTADVI